MSADSYSGSSSAHTHRYDLFGMIRRRVVVSIAATVGWMSLTLLFLAFWATGFSLLQDIVVVVVSLMVLGGVLLGAWISFGLRMVDP